MASTRSLHPRMDLQVEPDLQPLYPTPPQISHLLSPNVGLSPSQKEQLISHCLTRACIFGDFTLLSYLLLDPLTQSFLDLSKQEDGLGLIAITILGFSSESERDVEREECVRLLISEGADVNLPDHAGWISLHHAALLAPPTLVSYLLTHGCSPFTVTRRKLTALDIVTASTTLPGREDVSLLLQEAMRGQGWTGGRMEERRRSTEKRLHHIGQERDVQEDIARHLHIDPHWWRDTEESPLDSDVLEEEEQNSSGDLDLFTPPLDYTSILAFSPHALPDIFQSVITDFRPRLRNSEPANVLYMLSRFAILYCDHNWVEDLIIGATDAIEDTAFTRAEDLPSLVFWLYNLTIWLHLMKCDDSIRETCELLDSYTLIEEILNSVFVFIIRFAERRIDEMLDAALLDFSPLSSDFDSIQFESEWSFLRSFGGGKKKLNGTGGPSPSKSTTSMLDGNLSRSPSPPLAQSKGSFASLRQTFARARNPGSVTPLQSLFNDPPPTSPTPSPQDIISFMTSLHSLLTISDINPAITTQFWSQVMFWTACETFNRVLTRKKYLCRSRALQINMNLSVIEEWIGKMGLPRGIGSHFASVRDLLNWLQCLSSITEFPTLIATIQSTRNLNPLQMRRAVREYKYEVNEGRMTEECVQYLAQLQKDWERHRVKMGVEALRKEIGERERERERDDNDSPPLNEPAFFQDIPPSPTPSLSPEMKAAQHNIDMLFDRSQAKSTWEPPKPPEVLGELLDSRHMLPLLLPSDPKLLSAVPSNRVTAGETRGVSTHNRNGSRASFKAQATMTWHLNSRKFREVGISTLQWVDGAVSAARWYRQSQAQPEDEEDKPPPPYSSDDPNPDTDGSRPITSLHLPPLTRKPSTRSRGGRASTIHGDDAEYSVDLETAFEGHRQAFF